MKIENNYIPTSSSYDWYPLPSDYVAKSMLWSLRFLLQLAIAPIKLLGTSWWLVLYQNWSIQIRLFLLNKGLSYKNLLQAAYRYSRLEDYLRLGWYNNTSSINDSAEDVLNKLFFCSHYLCRSVNQFSIITRILSIFSGKPFQISIH